MLEKKREQVRLARVIISLAKSTCHNCDNHAKCLGFKVPDVDNDVCVACIGANLKEKGK